MAEAPATLPPLLDGETPQRIRDRMLADMPARFAMAEGSWEWDLLASMSIQQYDVVAIAALAVLQNMFIATCSSPYLDLHGAQLGLPRRLATPSTGVATLTGVAGTVVQAGSRVSTAAGQSSPAQAFETRTTVTLASGGTDVQVTAIEPGTAGNVAAAAIRVIGTSVAGWSGVTNAAATVGGTDVEADAAYRTRLLARAGRELGAGNVDDYLEWTMAQPNVGWVFVDPLWNGPGTVRIVILDAAGDIPPPATVSAVQAALDPIGQQGHGQALAPIGAYVSVIAPTERDVLIAIPALLPDSGYPIEEARANAEAAARTQVLIVNPGGVLRVRDVEAAVILAPGVLDSGDVLLDGARENIELDAAEKATVADVVFA